MAQPAGVFRHTFLDSTGRPLAGGRVYVYVAGSSTPATVYRDRDLTVPHEWPVRLDAGGRATLYVAGGTYDVVVTDRHGVVQLPSVSGIEVLDPASPKPLLDLASQATPPSPSGPVTARLYYEGARRLIWVSTQALPYRSVWAQTVIPLGGDVRAELTQTAYEPIAGAVIAEVDAGLFGHRQPSFAVCARTNGLHCGQVRLVDLSNDPPTEVAGSVMTIGQSTIHLSSRPITLPSGVRRYRAEARVSAAGSALIVSDARLVIFGRPEGHADVAHVDGHGDASHADSPHQDVGHTDQGHVDADHTDVSHGDTHQDVAHQDAGHADSHNDVAHTDTHSDTHGDVPHGDANHGDTAHGDTHSDTPHGDSEHADTHSDISHQDAHSDAEHSDSHTDTPHQDEWIPEHGDHTDDVFHQDSYGETHNDVAHDDVHGDSEHGDAHNDVAHQDSHGDSPHQDVAHEDTHADSPHGDSQHSDSPGENTHSDTHSDVAHQDSHADSPHADSHTDQHTDTPHSDTPHQDSPHGDTSHQDTPHQDGGHDDVHCDGAHADQTPNP